MKKKNYQVRPRIKNQDDIKEWEEIEEEIKKRALKINLVFDNVAHFLNDIFSGFPTLCTNLISLGVHMFTLGLVLYALRSIDLVNNIFFDAQGNIYFLRLLIITVLFLSLAPKRHRIL